MVFSCLRKHCNSRNMSLQAEAAMDPSSYTTSTNRAEPPRERDVPALLDGSRFLPLEVSVLRPEEARSLVALRSLRPDFVLTTEWEDREHSFVVEYKRTSTPKALEAAIQQARRYAEAGP